MKEYVLKEEGGRCSLGNNGYDDIIFEYLEKNNGVYLISPCGSGKSYLIEEKFLKKYRTVNCNFLNVLNEQNFKESYKEGERAARNYDGSDSITINIQNLSKISDDAAKKVELLVIDEIQEHWFASDYRRAASDDLEEQIKRFQSFGAKVLLMTGTPICVSKLVERLGLEVLIFDKEKYSEPDKYDIHMVEGLTIFNVGKYAQKLIARGKTVVILSDNSRKIISKELVKSGIEFCNIQSCDKKIEGTATNYIIKEQKLPEDCSCFLSTSILAGGVNLKETKDEKDIVYISFIKDIKNPHRAIQYAGRSRNQVKQLRLGYKKEEEFNIEFTDVVYKALNNLVDLSTNQEMKDVLSKSFNTKLDWSIYIFDTCRTESGSCVVNDTFDEKADKTDLKTERMDWKKFASDIKALKKEGTSFNDYFKIKATIDTTGVKIIDNPNGKGQNMWAFCTNVQKGRDIINALDLGFDVEKYSDAEISTACKLTRYAKLFNRMTLVNQSIEDKTFKNYVEKLKDEVVEGKFTSLFDVTFKNVFDIEFIVNGKQVDSKSIVEASKSEKKKISEPLELITNYRDTFTSLVREDLHLASIRKDGEDFLKQFENRVPEFFGTEYKSVSGLKKAKTSSASAARGAAAKDKLGKKIEVISDYKDKLKAGETFNSKSELKAKGFNNRAIDRLIGKGILKES